MPGAWPAHVLIATTSGRPSLPLPVSAACVTPSAPDPRFGSGGAFFNASKSDDDTDVSAGAVASVFPTAHCRTSWPL